MRDGSGVVSLKRVSIAAGVVVVVVVDDDDDVVVVVDDDVKSINSAVNRAVGRRGRGNANAAFGCVKRRATIAASLRQKQS
jgi:hypothetical protein